MTELFISLKNDGKLNVVAMFTTHFLSSVLGGSFPRVPMSTFQRDRLDEGRKSVPWVKNKKIYIVSSFNKCYITRIQQITKKTLEMRREWGAEVAAWPAILYSFRIYNCFAPGDDIMLWRNLFEWVAPCVRARRVTPVHPARFRLLL